jgi:hypothetical protein
MKKKSISYKNGGTSKNEWISDKIAKMLSEGKNLGQATAISNAMYNSGNKQYQNGGNNIAYNSSKSADDWYLDYLDKSAPNSSIIPTQLEVKSHLKPIDYIQSGVTNDKLGSGYYISNSDGQREFVTKSAYENNMINTPQLQNYLRDSKGIGKHIQGTENKTYRPIEANRDSMLKSHLQPIDYIQTGVTNDKLGNGYYLNYKNGQREFITNLAYEQNKNNSTIGDYLKNAGGLNKHIQGTEDKIYRPQYQFGATSYIPPKNIGWSPQSTPTATTLYQEPNIGQEFIQNNPLPNYQINGFDVNPNIPQTPTLTQEKKNPLSADTGSGYQTDKNGDNVDEGKTKFFNPYGGFDIPSAAYTLGQGIQTGNGFDIATGGLKLLSGLGINVASGMGQANRREWILDEYGKKVREGSRPSSDYQQNGGYFQNEDEIEDIIPQMRDGGIPDRYKNMGFNKVGIKKQSTRPGKKWMVLAKKGDQYKIVHGGDDNMKDFSQHHSEDRKKNFWNRMGGRDSAKANDAFSPLYWHKKFGTWRDGGMEMGQQAPPQNQEPSPEQIIRAFAQLAQEDPKQIMSELQQMQPQEQQQALQQMMQALQENSQPQDQGQDGEQDPAQEAQQMMQMGGLKKKVIGEHVGENVEGNHVAELEGNEFLKTPNGEIREVVGNSHAQGGVKLTEEQLPNGSEIISDHLEVGEEGAKRFNDNYDLGIKSTDTYATVLDKFNKKSGIKKIVDEQEMVQKNIEKQVLKLQENPSSEDTIKLNLELFTDQFKELQDKKTPLEEARKVFFDEVFQPQEESKEPNGHNYLEAQEPILHPADEEYKNGGEKNSLWRNIRNNRGSGKAPTKQMLEQEAKINRQQMGGMYNDNFVIGYSKKHNLHPDRIRELMGQHQNGGLQQYQNGDTFKVSNNTNVNSKNKRDRQAPNKEAYGITKSEQALQQLYNNFPDIINSDTAFKQYIDVADNGTLKFKGGVPLNKQASIVGNAQRMMDIRMLDSANTIINNPTQFSEDAVKEAQRYAQDETFLSNADTYTQDPTKSIRGYDNKLGDFTSGRYLMQMNLVTTEERKMLNDAGITTIKQLKTSPLRQKLSSDSIANVDKIQGLIGDTNADYGIAEITPEKKALKTTPTEENTFKTNGYIASVTNNKTRYKLANLPDQSPLLPDGLQGALKLNTRYDRVETPFVSPDAQITEIRRQEQSAMQGLQGLPDAQRASAIAQVQANSQNALNQAIAQSQGANQQAKFNADVTNAQIQMKEEDMRNNNLQNYENKITKADTLTQQNLRNYYNNAQKVNLTNYNYVQGLNLVNDRFDNAQFDGQGMNMVALQKAKDYDSWNAKTLDQQEAELKQKRKAEKDAQKITTRAKARFGGNK